MNYTSEINRLFGDNGDTDIFHQVNTSNFSLFSQSPINNSSSTDSTSPESFLNASRIFNQQESPFRDAFVPRYELFEESPVSYRHLQQQSLVTLNQWHHDHKSPLQWQDQASPIRTQRPIIGRKLMTSELETPYKTKLDPMDRWHDDSPKPSNMFIDQNIVYELFPTENKSFDFKSIHSSIPTISPTSSYSQISSSKSISPTNIGANSAFTRSSSQLSQQSLPNDKLCTFCKKNGETPSVYLTHYVKERIGNKQRVTCPILRSLVCSTCGVSGDNAHTITYCPVLRNSNNGQPLQSTTITLKNTRIQSNVSKFPPKSHCMLLVSVGPRNKYVHAFRGIGASEASF